MAQHTLIQIFLPLYDNDGIRFSEADYKNLQQLLTEKFSGVTIYQRAPAKGLWKEEAQKVVRDDLVIYEVLTDFVDQRFWKDLKARLLTQFRQLEIMIRSSTINLL